ncbi:hypothetical protein HMPREF1991_00698 [Hoylesella loescheii DSM 19665 = JCM 12249 = ATCC 15930]|uniref:Uncharacterized protein n=1 Tax=Hoylesella loescheii DSM 19665 = JCM 12249 = ATCC 15930 TaxID=1122985 RepID=A0A069QMJ9_HOYLO|nr:hypothetical protein HMPREF1991_00698 [Hoylesella loescheii DSM 19665 = JCM 12249 = ATCC 15930]
MLFIRPFCCRFVAVFYALATYSRCSRLEYGLFRIYSLLHNPILAFGVWRFFSKFAVS